MIIQRAYKTELKPNNKQRTLCMKHAGTSRFAYNWGLQRKKGAYMMNQLPIPHIKYPTAIDLHRELNKLKKTDFYWMYETSKCAPQEALRDLDTAFTNFFEKRAGYPNFKSRKKGIGSFRLTGAIHVFNNSIQLPRMGKVRLKERNYLPINNHVLSATVTEHAGRWFVSVQVEEEVKASANNNRSVAGVDLGIKNLATVSDGTIFENPKPLSHYERKLKRTQREVSRRKKGSNNRRKSVWKLQKTHMRIGNIRKDSIHKATSWLAKNKLVIAVEDLNLSGMVKNHKLAGAILDAGMGMFRRQLEYKTTWYGSQIIVADSFYPSSKTCSVCGHIKENLTPSERVFTCEECHSQIDRDLNASINLMRLAISSMESINACQSREVSFPFQRRGEVLGNEAGNKYHIRRMS